MQRPEPRAYLVGFAGEVSKGASIEFNRSWKLPGAGAGSISGSGGAGTLHVTWIGAHPYDAPHNRTIPQALKLLLIGFDDLCRSCRLSRFQAHVAACARRGLGTDDLARIDMRELRA